MNDIIILIFGLIIVFLGSLLFTNGIEYFAKKLNWSKSFTGSIISPIFTSFPELIIIVIAVTVYGGKSGFEISLGTIFGEPFMSSSVAYSFILLAVIFSFLINKSSKKEFVVDRILYLPYLFIIILFPLILLPHYFPFLSIFLAILFLFSYFLYIYLIYKKAKEFIVEEVEIPYFGKIMKPMFGTIFQLILSLILLYFGSNLLIESIEKISSYSSISSFGLSILIIPIGTGIPETLTAMIWAYQGKDTFAISSLVGEKILYATFYPGIALFFIPWVIDFHGFLSVLATTIISLIYLYYIRKGKIPLYALSFGLIFFISYIILIFIIT